jgi:phosphohistidine phosphatase
MRLYLVQHGEACSKEVDPERPLTVKGENDVDNMAGFLGAAGVKVDCVIHSGKLRAQQTAERLAGSLAPGVEIETSDRINPNDAPQDYDWLGEGADTLVVGHLPFMEKAVSYLTVGDTNLTFAAYQPGSVVCLESVENNRWRLNWMIRPELLG